MPSDKFLHADDALTINVVPISKFADLALTGDYVRAVNVVSA